MIYYYPAPQCIGSREKACHTGKVTYKNSNISIDLAHFVRMFVHLNTLPYLHVYVKFRVFI